MIWLWYHWKQLENPYKKDFEIKERWKRREWQPHEDVYKCHNSIIKQDISRGFRPSIFFNEIPNLWLILLLFVNISGSLPLLVDACMMNRAINREISIKNSMARINWAMGYRLPEATLTTGNPHRSRAITISCRPRPSPTFNIIPVIEVGIIWCFLIFLLIRLDLPVLLLHSFQHLQVLLLQSRNGKYQIDGGYSLVTLHF